MESHYDELKNSQNDSEDPLLTSSSVEDRRSKCARCSRLQSLLLISWLMVLCICSSLIYWIVNAQAHNTETSEWRDSDFAPVTREVSSKYEQVLFNATLKYNTSHQVYRPVTTPAYVGSPSKDIDTAWHELIGAINIFVTPEEAAQIGEEFWLDPETGLHMGQVTAFHDLHCLNFIRKAMHLDYYTEIEDWTLSSHVEHCIEMIRLSLMCTADMTLMPVKWSTNRGWIKPQFETVHTCRNYEDLRLWSLNRDAADPNKYMDNARRLRLKSGSITKLDPFRIRRHFEEPGNWFNVGQQEDLAPEPG